MTPDEEGSVKRFKETEFREIVPLLRMTVDTLKKTISSGNLPTGITPETVKEFEAFVIGWSKVREIWQKSALQLRSKAMEQFTEEFEKHAAALAPAREGIASVDIVAIRNAIAKEQAQMRG